ncbi:MAG: hypothetical protein PHS71_07235 [Proteiniphilum sp.]|nr:hypothetical protein [Proteiniphilum sp.]
MLKIESGQNGSYEQVNLWPNNIIIQENGHPIVLDFGIARDLDDETITPTGFQPFTWNFGSPEQYFFKRELISSS